MIKQRIETSILSSGTHTLDGFIPHLRHASGHMLPVKVWVDKNRPREWNKPQAPQRDTQGNLIYALPCGGSMIHRDGSFETSQMIG